MKLFCIIGLHENIDILDEVNREGHFVTEECIYCGLKKKYKIRSHRGYEKRILLK